MEPPIRGRFPVDPEALRQPQVPVDAAQARHMQVMRLGPGDRVALFDGAGHEVVAEIESLGADGAVANPIGPPIARPDVALQVTLVQALPVKIARLETIVRQATELGVVEIRPVIAARSQVPGGGLEVLQKRRVRWQRLAEVAAKQSGRSLIPRVTGITEFAALEWTTLTSPRLLLDPGAAPGSLTAGLSSTRPSATTLLVGPEGGWSPEEAQTARDRGALPVALGPRILRADSAGVAALSVLQYVWGDLG